MVECAGDSLSLEYAEGRVAVEVLEIHQALVSQPLVIEILAKIVAWYGCRAK